MSLFDLLIVQPIFNLLMLIYGIIPNFGIGIIIFTIIIRFLLWPLVKKQVNQAAAMRKMQPELTKIRNKHKNNRQAQGLAMMELYKKYDISPFSSIGVLLIQLPILIGMYRVVQLFVMHRDQLGKYTYGFMENLQNVSNLIKNPDQFNQNLFGVIDLTKHAISSEGVAIGLIIISLIAALLQYAMSKQTSPNTNSNRRMRDIMAEAAQGKEADQAEINAIVMQRMMKFMPIMLFFIMISLPGALALYLATSNAVAYVQNRVILNKNEAQEDKKPAPKSKTKARSTKSKSSAKKRAKQATEAKVIRIKAKD